jgi:hypothetical protein
MNIHTSKDEFGMEVLSPAERRMRIESLWLTAETLCDALQKDRELRHYAPLINMLERELKNSFTSIVQHEQ